MKQFSNLALAIAFFLAAASLAAVAEDKPAEARDSDPWYVSATVGGVFAGGLNDQSFNVQAGSVTATGNQGFTLGNGRSLSVQGGREFDRFRVEGEFLYQNYGRNDTTFSLRAPGGAPLNTSMAGSRVDTFSGFVNGYYDFKGASRFTPYVGVGVGVTKLDAAARTSSGSILQSPGFDQSVFAYQAKAGMSYRMTDATSMFLQYRYMGTAGFHYGGATIMVGGPSFTVQPVTGSLSNHTVELGVRLRL